MKTSRRLHIWLDSADRAFVSAIDKHANLITLLVVLGLCTWGIVTQHLWFDVSVVCIGAIAYYLGAAVSFLFALMMTILNAYWGIRFDQTLTTSLLELIGYILVARLGFQHRQEQAALRKQRAVPNSHSEQVIPWHVSNDMRTSLAAIRFLLFPVKDESNRQALEEAVKELARLESLFQSLEGGKQESTNEIQQGHIK